MHVTTRIPGHPHDDLLSRNGARGFPTLQFLDADGKVLATVGDRTVATFEEALDALHRIEAVRARAQAGDPLAEADLLLMEQVLGRVELSMFRERAAMLKGPSSAQRARVDQTLVDLAIWEAVGLSDEKLRMQRLLAILNAGQRPSNSPRYAVNFWSMLGRHGQTEGDAALLRRVIAGIRETMAGDAQIQAYADSLEVTAVALEARDALRARADAGEAGLEAEILLAEFEVNAVSLEDYRARLDAALAVADEAQQEALRQGEVDLEVYTLWVAASLRQEGHENAGPRLLELLCSDGRKPSEMHFRQGLSIAARWADQHLEELDAVTLAGLAQALEDYYGAFEYWAPLRERVAARRAELEPVKAPSGG